MDFKICPAVFTKMPCRKIDTSFRTHICPWMVTSSRLSANNISKNNCTSLRQFCTFLGLTELAGRCFGDKFLFCHSHTLALVEGCLLCCRGCTGPADRVGTSELSRSGKSLATAPPPASRIAPTSSQWKGCRCCCPLPGRQPVYVHVTVVTETTFV